MKAHNLKVKEEYWSKYLKIESWSIRNNDRDFQVGDVCLFTLVKNKMTKHFEKMDGALYSQTEILKIIESITYHDDFPEGLQKGYCILSLRTLIEVTPTSKDV